MTVWRVLGAGLPTSPEPATEGLLSSYTTSFEPVPNPR